MISGTAIRSLLGRCRPSTVARFVIPVNVASVDGRSCGPLSHISEEVCEILPALADCDAPPAIEGILKGVGVTAALAHRHPTLPSRGTSHSMFRAIGGKSYQTLITWLKSSRCDQHNRSIPMLTLPFVMHAAQAGSAFARLFAAFNGAGGNLCLHREPSLSGVWRAAVHSSASAFILPRSVCAR